MDNTNRIHIGTGQGKLAFTEAQVDQIEKVLNRYFKGWQGTDGTRNWNGHIEKIRTYTIPPADKPPTELSLSASPLLSIANTLQICASQLHEKFPGAFLVLEQNGKETALQAPVGVKKKLKPLPKGLSKQTEAIITFYSELEGLKRIYWLLRAAIQDFTSRKTDPSDKLANFINATVLDKLNISRGELKEASGDVELRMRHMMIASAVSYHEGYLTTVLEDFFVRTAKPDRYINIGIRLNEIGPDGISKGELERRAAKTVVGEIINSKYQERFNKIAKFIKDLNGCDVRDYWNDDKLGAAPFEVRNCIIHSAGVADTRAVAELQWLFPSIKLGKQLPIDEGMLWKLLGALERVAEVIDATIRIKN